MKEPIALPFVFLLIFIIALAGFSVLDIFSAWGYSTAGVQAFTLRFAAQRFPQSALFSLIPAVMTALILCGLRSARRRISRFLVFAILLGAGYIVLVNGMLLLKGAGTAVPAAPSAARLYIEPKAFTEVGSSVLHAQSVTDAAAKGVLVYTANAGSRERLTVQPAGTVSESKGSLIVDFGGSRVTGAPPPTAGRAFEADAFTKLFLRDIGVLTSDLRKLAVTAPAEFFVAAFALLFLCTASIAIMRFTRWPMINALVFTAAVRGYLLLHHFLSVTVGPEIGKGVTDPLFARLFPSVAFIVLGVLFLIIDIVFIPADRLKQGEAL